MIKLKSIMWGILFLSSLVFSDINYRIGSAEIFGSGGITALPDTGYSVLYNPSLLFFNTKGTIINVASKYLYSRLEDISINDYSAGLEYKMNQKYTIGAVGNYFKISDYKNIFLAVGCSYQIKNFLSLGASLHIDKIESVYFKKIKNNLVLSGTYSLHYIFISPGLSIYDISGNKTFSVSIDGGMKLSNWKVSIHNAYVNNYYVPSLGCEFNLIDSLILRFGLNLFEYSAGLGLKIYNSLLLNYAFSYHSELGYSNYVDIKLIY